MTKRPSSTRRCHMGPPEADICAIARTLAQQFNLTGADSPDALPAECPEPAKVVDALRILLDIIFPGKITSPPDGPSELGVFQLRRLSELWPLLYHQIRRALPYRWLGEAARVQGVRPPKVANLDRETSRILRAFFKTLPAVRELLIQDVQAAYDGDPAAHTYAEVLLAYPGLLAIAAHRLSHELYKLKVPIIPRIMSEWIHTKTGTDIHPGARIGKAFFIDHATGASGDRYSHMAIYPYPVHLIQEWQMNDGKVVTIRPIRQPGGEADFNEVFLDDVFVPDSQRVGAVGGGWKVTLTGLMSERLSIGGVMPPDLWRTFATELQRTPFAGAAALRDGRFRERLEDLYIVGHGLWLLQCRALTALGKGREPGPEMSGAKILVAQALQTFTRLGIDLQGPRGVLAAGERGGDFAMLERLWFGAAGIRIAGGTDEIVRNSIGERVLGLASEPRTDKGVPFNQLGL